MKKHAHIDFRGYANHRVYEMIAEAIAEQGIDSNAPMTLRATLNGARALAAQNQYQFNVFEQLRRNYPNLVVVLVSCEFDDLNEATLHHGHIHIPLNPGKRKK